MTWMQENFIVPRGARQAVRQTVGKIREAGYHVLWEAEKSSPEHGFPLQMPPWCSIPDPEDLVLQPHRALQVHVLPHPTAGRRKEGRGAEGRQRGQQWG